MEEQGQDRFKLQSLDKNTFDKFKQKEDVLLEKLSNINKAFYATRNQLAQDYRDQVKILRKTRNTAQNPIESEITTLKADFLNNYLSPGDIIEYYNTKYKVTKINKRSFHVETVPNPSPPKAFSTSFYHQQKAYKRRWNYNAINLKEIKFPVKIEGLEI